MKETVKQAALEDVAPEVLERIKEVSRDGRISCGVARRVAGDLGVPIGKIGDAADALGLKIFACELGCF